MSHWVWRQARGRTEDGGGRSGYGRCCDGCSCGHDCVKLGPGMILDHEYRFERVKRLAQERGQELAATRPVPTGQVGLPGQ